MVLGMDISQMAHPGGVGVYTKNLAKALLNQPSLDLKFFYSSLRSPFRGGLPNVRSYLLPPTLFEILFNRIRNVSIERFLGPIDIFHSSDWVQPPARAKKVTTYHDVIALKYPHLSLPKIVAVQKRRLKLVEQEIDMVIAVSEATKNDLMKISSIPEEKIVVIYEGVGKHFKPQDELKKKNFRKKYHLPQKFVLAIGGLGERRNLKAIRQAISQDYQLVISSETIPLLSDEELPVLYSCAEVLLYPSFYEGFGLPILEAMATGTAVITSNVSSMPEVGGEAAMYVDPYNVSDIKDKLKMVMEDSKLRKDMIKKGFNQAKKFSWEKCAEETVEVYRLLLNK